MFEATLEQQHMEEAVHLEISGGEVVFPPLNIPKINKTKSVRMDMFLLKKDANRPRQAKADQVIQHQNNYIK